MPPADPFLVFSRALERSGIRYMVSGSIAAIYYGEPRLTNDIDIIVFLKGRDVARLREAFPETDFYRPPDEVILLEIGREQRGHFNLIHHETGFKADIYVVGCDPLHEWGVERARTVELSGERVCFAPPEYVILRKLEYFREGGSEKHLRDIAGMLAGLGPKWDRQSLFEKIVELVLEKEWERAESFGSTS